MMLTTHPCGDQMFALEIMASEGPSSASKHRRQLGIEVGKRMCSEIQGYEVVLSGCFLDLIGQ